MDPQIAQSGRALAAATLSRSLEGNGTLPDPADTSVDKRLEVDGPKKGIAQISKPKDLGVVGRLDKINNSLLQVIIGTVCA